MNDPSAPDGGSATVLVLGVCLVAFVLVTTVAALGSAVAARHRAESSADLASLAAADVLLGRAVGTPCEAARQVLARNGPPDREWLVECRTRGRRAWVRVAVRPAGWVALLGTASAHAGAGPATPSTGVRSRDLVGGRLPS
jgi:secretion/DNA translocation related TadE-like protein